ncbi:MAG: hypothetical protein FWD28_05825 [Treponema sp.]|nr:hypothetical protein [Treponema sp.]
MKILKISCFFLIIIFLVSCAGRQGAFRADPDFSIYESSFFINVNDITENRNLPPWLSAYIAGGIIEIEKMEVYSSKYTFVAINEGLNFSVLTRWSENLSPIYDFPILAAARIEERMVSAASFFPDDEYGSFFEAMMKSAYSGRYPGAEKAGAHWIRIRKDNEEKYMFFALLTIDKTAMQGIINSMTARTVSSASMTSAQRSSVNRLRQNFFEGF